MQIMMAKPIKNNYLEHSKKCLILIIQIININKNKPLKMHKIQKQILTIMDKIQAITIIIKIMCKINNAINNMTNSFMKKIIIICMDSQMAIMDIRIAIIDI